MGANPAYSPAGDRVKVEMKQDAITLKKERVRQAVRR